MMGPDPEGPRRGRDGGRTSSLLSFSSLASISASTMKGSSLKRQRRLLPEEELLVNPEGSWVSLFWVP